MAGLAQRRASRRAEEDPGALPSTVEAADGLSRRRFLGYLLAAPTIVAGAELFLAQPALASLPTVQPVDAYDLTDLLTDATLATSNLITVVVNTDGTVSFALPRAEVGQGITAAVAITIADEVGLAIDKVKITLANARPELVWNQLTGGSNSMHSIFTPVRTAAATARGRLAHTAARMLGGQASSMTVRGGVATAPDGRSLTFGELASEGAVSKTTIVRPQLKPHSALALVGTPQRRIDALEIVTGTKQFAKLMWHRTDNFRQGRVHPMCTSRVRIAYSGSNVLAFDQRHTSVATDFTHGFGEILTAQLVVEPVGDLGYAETIFTLTQNVPYNFGPVTQLLNEIYEYDTFNTSSKSVRATFSKPPSCVLKAPSRTVSHARSKHPKSGQAPSTTLTLRVTCDQSATVTLAGTITELLHSTMSHRKPRTKTVRIPPTHASAGARLAKSLTLIIPTGAARALAAHIPESASFRLAATNTNGTGTASLKLQRLSA